ncbi:glycoside hydrolase family 19 protein [Thauera sp.]|jgi:predicted chitinase|uniref:glycoside hydrolase family 19 protein n=1 Tax=Thauera sp. TaxID=1905334 RepID=UPI0026199390|nr:glycoside hydrolase family 19 protein [Thauera sp.]MCK6407756.1 glycoside hydrolase family 19 protein [Thauera sp.]
MLIAHELLTRMGATGANADKYLDTLNAVLAVHGIDSEARIAHFLAQVMHESGCLRLVQENLNYSAEGLRNTFRKYFRTDAEAQAYARQPERIGSRVYGGRMGNGPESTGDGYRYRGRGLIQLTGKDNYRSFAQWVGADVVANPDWVAERYAVQSAVYFWEKNDLNALADIDDLSAITRRINGGLNGYEDRHALLLKARRTLAELAAAGTVETAPASVALQPTHRVKATQLTLRSAPVVAERTRLALLNQGKDVQVLGAASEPGWVRVRVSLSGLLREGVVAEPHLEPLPRTRSRGAVMAAAAPALPALPVAHMKEDRAEITRRLDGGRAYPLGEPGRPARSGRNAESLAQSVAAIVDYLDVANPAHLRYQPQGGTTYCNIYATDLAYLCGAYLPRVWWTDRALLRLREGERVAVEYGRTVRELNANSLYDWLEDFGPAFGWKREIELTALQAAANAGEVCVIVARRVDLNRPGHITAVVPESATVQAVRNAHREVQRPLESQAGTRNVLRAPAASAWWQNSRFQAFAFWRHP